MSLFSLFTQNNTVSKSYSRQRLLWMALSLVLVGVFVVLYVYGTVQQATYVNHGGTDQGSYGRFTRNLYDDPLYIDGARMPLFPMIVRLFYTPDLSDAALFELGKLVGIGVSLAALAAIAVVFFRYFRRLLALDLLLITAFLVFIYKAPYYHPELLYYTLFFCAFVFMCRAFQRFTPRLAIIIGLLLGLAMLAKASAVTTLAVFAVLIVLQLIASRLKLALPVQIRRQPVQTVLVSLGLVMLVFALLMSGYMATSQRVFGTLFYNASTTFYMWYDSWDDVRAGTRAHGDRVGWPDMPEEDLPSMGKYLAEHRPREILNRILDGLEVNYNKHCTTVYANPYGNCKYVVAFSIAAVVAVALNLPLMWGLLKRNVFLVLFCAAVLVTQVLMAAWWMPISASRRFMLAVFLPYMFVMGAIINLPGLKSPALTIRRVRLDLRTLFLAGVLVAVLIDTYFVLTSRIFSIYGGE